ncbi:MAG: ACT domain-containing protein [Clostridium sp.]
MGKAVKVNFNQGMDSMVRVLNYFRRKEVEVLSIDMRMVSKSDIQVEIFFDNSMEDERILSHFEKLYDVKSIEIV